MMAYVLRPEADGVVPLIAVATCLVAATFFLSAEAVLSATR